MASIESAKIDTYRIHEPAVFWQILLSEKISFIKENQIILARNSDLFILFSLNNKENLSLPLLEEKKLAGIIGLRENSYSRKVSARKISNNKLTRSLKLRFLKCNHIYVRRIAKYYILIPIILNTGSQENSLICGTSINNICADEYAKLLTETRSYKIIWHKHDSRIKKLSLLFLSKQRIILMTNDSLFVDQRVPPQVRQNSNHSKQKIQGFQNTNDGKKPSDNILM